MSRSLEFDGWWEGDVVFTCDNCGKTVKFRFDDQESAQNASGQMAALRKKRGWEFLKFRAILRDFCCTKCRDEYIKNN